MLLNTRVSDTTLPSSPPPPLLLPPPPPDLKIENQSWRKKKEEGGERKKKTTSGGDINAPPTHLHSTLDQRTFCPEICAEKKFFFCSRVMLFGNSSCSKVWRLCGDSKNE